MSDDIGDDASDEDDRQVEVARAIQRQLDVAVARREAGPDERRLAAAYLSGRISLLPDAVEALRRLGLVGEHRRSTTRSIREGRPQGLLGPLRAGR